jgi:hypothetical protein
MHNFIVALVLSTKVESGTNLELIVEVIRAQCYKSATRKLESKLREEKGFDTILLRSVNQLSI